MASDRYTFALACKICKSRNYYFARGKKRTSGDKLELKKLCRKCAKHTLHKEIKA